MDASRPADELVNMDGMEEIIKEFLVESHEGLDRFDRDMLGLEKDGSSRELLDSVFRAIHTIKGTGGVLGYDKLVSVAHVGESLLSRMRDGSLALSPEIATALLNMADVLRRMLEEIAANGSEGNADCSDVLSRLNAVLNAASPPPPAKSAAKGPESVVREPGVPPRIGDILVSSQLCDPFEVEAAAELQQQGDPRLLGEILVASGAAHPEAVAEGLKVQSDHRDVSSNTIRVDVALLDKVMNLVGELVLARNQILQFTASQEDSGFLSTAQRLNLITTELQEGVMKTRMQPIGNVWNKFPRIVRDLSVGCGKQVEVEMEGKETELDKTIIEAIKDPLTHIVRNAVDHGIETAGAARGRGQAAPKAICCCAPFTKAGRSTSRSPTTARASITEKLKAKAIAKGLVISDHAAPHDRARGAEPDLRARLLHRRESHQRLRPRRGHGRGEDQHREDRRHGRPAKHAPARARR